MLTFKLYWYIISGTNGHLSRTTNVPKAGWLSHMQNPKMLAWLNILNGLVPLPFLGLSIINFREINLNI
jgi:hypothetical protein